MIPVKPTVHYVGFPPCFQDALPTSISLRALRVKMCISSRQKAIKVPEAEVFSGPLGTLGEYLSAVQKD